MTAESLEYLKANCKVFIDQNLPSLAAESLRCRGFRFVYTVYDLKFS